MHFPAPPSILFFALVVSCAVAQQQDETGARVELCGSPGSSSHVVITDSKGDVVRSVVLPSLSGRVLSRHFAIDYKAHKGVLVLNSKDAAEVLPIRWSATAGEIVVGTACAVPANIHCMDTMEDMAFILYGASASPTLGRIDTSNCVLTNITEMGLGPVSGSMYGFSGLDGRSCRLLPSQNRLAYISGSALHTVDISGQGRPAVTAAFDSFGNQEYFLVTDREPSGCTRYGETDCHHLYFGCLLNCDKGGDNKDSLIEIRVPINGSAIAVRPFDRNMFKVEQGHRPVMAYRRGGYFSLLVDEKVCLSCDTRPLRITDLGLLPQTGENSFPSACKKVIGSSSSEGTIGIPLFDPFVTLPRPATVTLAPTLDTAHPSTAAPSTAAPPGPTTPPPEPDTPQPTPRPPPSFRTPWPTFYHRTPEPETNRFGLHTSRSWWWWFLSVAVPVSVLAGFVYWLWARRRAAHSGPQPYIVATYSQYPGAASPMAPYGAYPMPVTGIPVRADGSNPLAGQQQYHPPPPPGAFPPPQAVQGATFNTNANPPNPAANQPGQTNPPV